MGKSGKLWLADKAGGAVVSIALKGILDNSGFGSAVLISITAVAVWVRHQFSQLIWIDSIALVVAGVCGMAGLILCIRWALARAHPTTTTCANHTLPSYKVASHGTSGLVLGQMSGGVVNIGQSNIPMTHGMPRISIRVIEGLFRDWQYTVMDSFVEGDTPMAHSEVFIALRVGLTNLTSGTTATITDYSLSIETTSGTMQGAKVIPFVPYQVDRTNSTGFATASIHEMRILFDQPFEETVELEEMIRSSPLHPGIERVAWIQFKLHDVELGSDYKDNGVFRVRVTDSHGGTWEIERPAGIWETRGVLARPKRSSLQ